MRVQQYVRFACSLSIIVYKRFVDFYLSHSIFRLYFPPHHMPLIILHVDMC